VSDDAEVRSLREEETPESLLVLDPAWQTAAWRGQAVKLTPTQFALLTAMARQPRQPVSKAVLLEEVWGYTQYDPNVVEVQVAGLRKRLRALDPDLVSTVRSLGYVVNVVTVVKGATRPGTGGEPPVQSPWDLLSEQARATVRAARDTRLESQRVRARSAELQGRGPHLLRRQPPGADAS